ncbi:hypothetical protein BMS3Abin10_00703 [bacterium BMS3Abin10]|nr:hypothetical protein BMS3Abin10_00703 [bacterium BMS3Abin10]GBE38064.1 hypothetical protein BMS3Bbin08_00666 [bacterium BMS3Bbin08]
MLVNIKIHTHRELSSGQITTLFRPSIKYICPSHVEISLPPYIGMIKGREERTGARGLPREIYTRNYLAGHIRKRMIGKQLYLTG